MTLERRLAAVLSIIMLAALAGVQYSYLRSAQGHQQRQLESLAQDAATAIGLSLGIMMRGGDPVVPMVVINAAFDRGHYQRIELLGLNGEHLAGRALAAGEGGRYPAWFAALFRLDPTTAESMVAGGWRQLGKLRVTAHPRFAYEQLWYTARDTTLYLLAAYAAVLIALRLAMRSLLRPLRAIEGAAQAIGRREYVQIGERPPTRELARLVEAMNAMSSRVAQNIAAEVARAEALQRAAFTDEVSGLLNRRGMDGRFAAAYPPEHEPFVGAVALVEISGLAAIDRQLGRARCDELIGAAGRLLQDAAGGEHGLAARWAAPLFALFIPGVAGDAAQAALQELQGALDGLLRSHGAAAGEVRLGAVMAGTGRADAAALVAAAQEALAQSGRAPGEVRLVAAEARGAAATALAATVREAITSRRLLLFGQPLLDLRTGRPLQVEIMARVAAPGGELLSAAQFLPVVAQQGLSRQLDEAVIEAVLAALARAPEPRPVSVNLAASAMLAEGFIEALGAALGRAPEAARRLVFELSEHGAVLQEAAALRLSAALRDAGSALAIDHFGMHRASLALVGRLRPAYLKLSAAHTPLLRDPGTRFLVDSLVRAAAQLGAPLHAQGVEDRELLVDLVQLGFAGYQGHAAGAPAPWPGAGAT